MEVGGDETLGALSTMQEYFPSSPPFSPPSPLTTTPNVSDALSYGYHAVILWTELFVSSLPVLRSAVTKPSMLIRINTLTFFRAWLYVPAFNDSYNGGMARCGKHHRGAHAGRRWLPRRGGRRSEAREVDKPALSLLQLGCSPSHSLSRPGLSRRTIGVDTTDAPATKNAPRGACRTV
jgi:hypothetical protein